MALPARPCFLIATHIPHSVTVKYSSPLSQLIKWEASNSSVCCVWREPHQAEREYSSRQEAARPSPREKRSGHVGRRGLAIRDSRCTESPEKVGNEGGGQSPSRGGGSSSSSSKFEEVWEIVEAEEPRWEKVLSVCGHSWETIRRHARPTLGGHDACFLKCQLWFHQPLRSSNRGPDAFRGKALGQSAPHLLIWLWDAHACTRTCTHTCFVQR